MKKQSKTGEEIEKNRQGENRIDNKKEKRREEKLYECRKSREE